MPDLIVAIDTETELIKPGTLAPRLACVTFCHFDSLKNDYANGIIHHKKALPDITLWLEGAARYDDVRIVGHNIAYDMAVLAAHSPRLLPLIFTAYERGNIEDTKLREQLIDIAAGDFWKTRKRKGGYSLLGLVNKYLPDFEMSKGADTYRLRYGELIDLPLDDWPEEAIDYARKDALATLLVYKQQQRSRIVDSETGELTNSSEQAAADFALHLMSCWGVVTDPIRTQEFIRTNQEIMECHREKLSRTGLMRLDGTKDLAKIRERIVSSLGREAKTTSKGNIATDSETLLKIGDPDLSMLVEYSKAQKLDSVWARYLSQGTNQNTPIQARFHCLMESGRTSCSGPNLQNPHRAAGLRECFVPREGYVYIACDYSTLELCTLAQVTLWLFGHSNMAKKLQEGADLHLNVAAQLMGITYEEAQERLSSGDRETKKMRQTAKILNFGLPGGMGSKSFADYAKALGLTITEAEAEHLKSEWFKAWPEMVEYFNYIGCSVGIGGGSITQFVSKRIRGGVTFTQACNTMFQGLASEGCKLAVREISKRCYINSNSALYCSRPIMFIHDEIIIESPIKNASAAGDELASVMRDMMRIYTPDIPIRTSLAMMDRWYKDAEEVRDSSGNLVCWKSEGTDELGRGEIST